jgi:hypothetical protein
MNRVTAFPVLRSDGSVAAVELLRRITPTRFAAFGPLADIAAATFEGERAMPLRLHLFNGHECGGFEIVGATTATHASHEGSWVLHPRGLPGAALISDAELRKHAHLLRADEGNEQNQDPHEDGMEHAGIYARAMSRHLLGDSQSRKSISGDTSDTSHEFLSIVSRLLHRQGIVESGAQFLSRRGLPLAGRLNASFPYHVPVGGGQSVRHFFDTTAAAVGAFGPFAHGEKRLYRYGVAATVGVLPPSDADGAPLLYWHASGCPGAALLPEIHALPSVSVGRVGLKAGGPHHDELLLQREELSRYCFTENRGDYDKSEWLCGGLFGAKVGEAAPGFAKHRVLGVRPAFVAGREELDLWCEGATSSAAVSLTELEIYG